MTSRSFAASPQSRVLALSLLVAAAIAAFGAATAQAAVQTINFNYPSRAGLLADGWSFQATSAAGTPRNTETTSGAVVSYNQFLHPGALRVPADEGDLWEALNDTRNSLFRSLPSNWTRVTLRLSFAPTQNYQHAGVAIYGDDDNYVQLMRTYDNGQHVTLVRESNGGANNVASEDVTATSNLRLRLEREGPFAPIEASYSLNGTTWTAVGSTEKRIATPKLGLTVGSSPGGFPPADFASVEIVTADESWPAFEDVLQVRPGDASGPGQLVFNGVAGQSLSTSQDIGIVAKYGAELPWTATSNRSWLDLSATSGETTGKLAVTVDTTGLAPGVHEGTVTVDVPAADNGTQTVDVSLIVNPASAVRLSPWKDGHRGAFSSSTDDGRSSGFAELSTAGFGGTFVMNGTTPPADYLAMHDEGMELGSHLKSHYCADVDEAGWRSEIEDNINGLDAGTPLTLDDIITLVWPCGYFTPQAQSIAAEYFLVARGYNINELEDTTPADPMNVKSFNSHEHPPLPPTDLKTVVDAAQAEGKWANLVLHDFSNDDGAIAYAATKDVWAAPIGTIMKYIAQRDRTVITAPVTSGDEISFKFSRLAVAPTVKRNFESAITASDQVTFRVDVGSAPHVASVTVGGESVPFELREVSGDKIVYFSSPVLTSQQTAVVEIAETIPPALSVSTNALAFEAVEGSPVAAKTFTVANSGPGTMAWTTSVGGSGPEWLSASPGSGSNDGTVTASVDISGLAPGEYTRTITVTAAATGSPKTVTVRLTVYPQGATRYAFDYADRGALLAAGWDFLGRTGGGSVRDTETLSGAVVTYNQGGALRIPADTGDLWAGINGTRNSLFRDLPANWTSAVVRLKFAPTQNTQQAGLVIYGDDDNYVQITRAYVNGQNVSFVNETSGSAAVLGAVPVTASAVYLRLDRSGESIEGSVSADGSTWTAVGSVSRTFSNPRLGLIVTASPSGFPPADISWVQVQRDVAPKLTLNTTSLNFSAAEGTNPASKSIAISNTGEGTLNWTASVAGSGPAWLSATPDSGSNGGTVTANVDVTGLAPGDYTRTITVAAAGATGSPKTVTVRLTVYPAGASHFAFDYADRGALSAAGWDFLGRTSGGSVRDTETTSGAVVSYDQGGALRVPADVGDLWAGINGTRNSIFRDLPANWSSAVVRLSFAPTQNTQQAGLVIYGDDDNYVQITRAFVNGQNVSFVNETGGSAAVLDAAPVTATDVYLRLDRSGDSIEGRFSLDGSTWTPLGSVSRTFSNPRLGLIVTASPSGFPPADISWVQVQTAGT